jgi:LacI family transcriptional regulator
MTTMQEVAARAGVSVSTVSHVINDTRHVETATRERVLQAVAELNYQPNRLARGLRNRQTATLGVLLPNSANPFFAQVLLGIEKTCFDLGYNIILGNAHDDPQRELFYLNTMLSKQVDGVLLISTDSHQEALDLLTRQDVPVVIADRSLGDRAVDAVFTNNKQGAQMATEYLLALGHRRIGCISGLSLLTPSGERVHGYRAALDAAGVPFDESLVIAGDFLHEGGYQACRHLLELSNPPTAIFACNDMMAIGALCAIHEAGLQVPADISVIGFDDIPLAAYTIPRLTTIAQPAEQLGHVAAQRLIRRLREGPLPVQQRRLTVSLIERDSCRAIANK